MGELYGVMVQWGRWTNLNSGMPGYKGASAMFAQLSGSVLPDPIISDETALGVDRAVALLIDRNRLAGHAVSVYFICNVETHAALGRVLGCSRSQARNLLDSGMSWLDGYFADLQEQSSSSLNAA